MSIPNILSIFRIVLIPVFIVCYLMLPDEMGWVPALVLVVSGATDVVDGYIARHYNMVTQLGKVLDPLADKLTLAAVVITVAINIPMLIPLAVIYVAKELLMLIGGLLIVKSGIKIQSSKWFGKLATVVFYIAMFIIILVPGLPQAVTVFLAALVAVMVLFAFGMYVNEFVKIKRTNHK